MFNNTWSSNPSSLTPDYPQVQSDKIFLTISNWGIGNGQTWLVFGAASFLVSVPVFFQAPLVRLLPELSLVMTAGWLWLSWALRQRPTTAVWGDLLQGFTWSWLAGSIYWGWLRWEPLIHLPIEAIGLPFALWCLWKSNHAAPLWVGSKPVGSIAPVQGSPGAGENVDFNSPVPLCTWSPLQPLPLTIDFLLPWGLVGNLFYLGSLFGTAVTDLYFYLTGLIPHWRQLMHVDPALATPIFQSAIAQVRTPWGAVWAVALVGVLLGVGLLSLRSRQLHWWAFGGAVLSTILVDSLFWLAASMA